VKNVVRALLAAALGVSVAGCMLPTLAPGAAQVKVTSEPADVKGCSAKGNVRDPNGIYAGMQNQAVGLNANVVFLTSMYTGIAYQCGQTTGP